MESGNKLIYIIIFMIITVLWVGPEAQCEKTAWDCPECGRTGNKGNYCGNCAHPAPWLETEEDNRTYFTQDFRTVGSIVTFGTYLQKVEGTDQTLIEWIVLDYDEENKKALLLSRYGLDTKPYNSEHTKVTWEECTLRSWLNDEFLHIAFNALEQSMILVTEVDNSSNQGINKKWTPNTENNTQDWVFLLSCTEARKYLDMKDFYIHNPKSRVSPTAYAISKGAQTIKEFQTEEGATACGWWLRSPGINELHAACVCANGTLDLGIVNEQSITVRPAFWLNLDSW